MSAEPWTRREHAEVMNQYNRDYADGKITYDAWKQLRDDANAHLLAGTDDQTTWNWAMKQGAATDVSEVKDDEVLDRPAPNSGPQASEVLDKPKIDSVPHASEDSMPSLDPSQEADLRSAREWAPNTRGYYEKSMTIGEEARAQAIKKSEGTTNTMARRQAIAESRGEEAAIAFIRGERKEEDLHAANEMAYEHGGVLTDYLVDEESGQFDVDALVDIIPDTVVERMNARVQRARSTAERDKALRRNMFLQSVVFPRHGISLEKEMSTEVDGYTDLVVGKDGWVNLPTGRQSRIVEHDVPPSADRGLVTRLLAETFRRPRYQYRDPHLVVFMGDSDEARRVASDIPKYADRIIRTDRALRKQAKSSPEKGKKFNVDEILRLRGDTLEPARPLAREGEVLGPIVRHRPVWHGLWRLPSKTAARIRKAEEIIREYNKAD